MKEKVLDYLLAVGLVLGGVGVGLVIAYMGWWDFLEPVSWTTQTSVLLIGAVAAWRWGRRLQASMPQKTFQITFGLRQGYAERAVVHSLDDAHYAIEEWMNARVVAGLPVVTGMTSPVTLFYPVRNGEDGRRIVQESSAIFVGSLSPKYDKGRSDTEIVETLNALAQHLGATLGQKRVYVSFANRQWTIDL